MFLGRGVGALGLHKAPGVVLAGDPVTAGVGGPRQAPQRRRAGRVAGEGPLKALSGLCWLLCLKGSLGFGQEPIRVARGLRLLEARIGGRQRPGLGAGTGSAVGIARGVFGSPFYITDTDERFWGQDRLDDLDLHLSGAI